MNEHPSDNLIEQFARRELAPDKLQAISEHLRGCAVCQNKAAARFDSENTLSAWREAFDSDAATSAHLEYADFVEYLDGRADVVRREIVESHTAVCAVCRDELNDLRAFRADLQKNNLPAPAEPVFEKTSLWRSIRAAFEFGFFARAALACLVLLLLAAGVFIFVSRRQNNDNAPERAAVNAAQPTPAPIAAPQISPETPPDIAAQETPTPEVAVPGVKPGEKDLPEILTAAERRAVESAIRAERLPVSTELAALRGKQSRLLGDETNESFRVETPVGVISRSPRPVFSWQKLDGAESYRVTIVDENLNQIAASGELKNNRWSPEKNLPRGKIYMWQVKAARAGRESVAPAPPAPEARFKILDAATENALQRLEKQAASPFALGVLYSRAGLTADARRAFEQAIRQNDRKDLARKFLRQLNK